MVPQMLAPADVPLFHEITTPEVCVRLSLTVPEKKSDAINVFKTEHQSTVDTLGYYRQAQAVVPVHNARLAG